MWGSSRPTWARTCTGGGIGIGALSGPAIGQFVDAVKVVGGAEKGSNFTMHALPANALYAHAMKGATKADPMFAE